MATISHMSISTPSLQLPRSCINSCGIQCRMVFALGPRPWDFNWRGEGNFGVLTNKILFRFVFAYFASPPSMHYWRRPSFVKISAASAKALDYTDGDSELPVVTSDNHEMGVSRTDYLLQVLHQSARRFCDAIKCHELARNGPQLAKAWIGVDVHAWHKHIAYQVAVYALLQTAKEMEIMLCGRHGNDTAPVCKILSPKVSILHNDIVTQLKMKDTKLVEWFKMELLPVFAGDFSTLLERWAVEYTESGVAANILATSCCIAAKKLGVGRISSPSFTSSLPDAIGELMDALYGLVSMDKLHSLASVAGFEQEFLAHFGSKILLNNTNPEVVFWLGLVQRKLVAAFQREGVVASLQNKILQSDLATLGIFAFLGKRTRLFLSRMGIKDVDEPVKDFLSYLECGSLFIYPELSSISLYQLFMEVVTEEIGWLDFYNAVPGISHQERKRSKQHAIQAEKEIILPAVFNVCSNVFSSFGYFSKSTQQSLDANLVAFLLRSQNLLNICLEDYWAAYDQSCKLPKVTELSLPELSSGNQDTVNVTILFEEVHEKVDELTTRWVTEYMPECMSRMRKQDFPDNILRKSSKFENLPRNFRAEKLSGMRFGTMVSTSMLNFLAWCVHVWKALF
ncbi:uncharacterized protein LOC131222995 isoform X3 [Magnolia sinica]|uniref:uncharacterized protein LOC131222995 isoform X3 n=1 Tax=Magnolia sinica TaxID=86752 RepID=UPI0026595AA8|nr:uncharacterized protein LOC131222995 isoform X3 [Magnolia sinica]